MPVMQGLETLKQKKIEVRVRDIMDLQKFGIKLFLNVNNDFNSRDFIPVFHHWIQDKIVDDHLLIDVADYSHVPDGPGVMLVAHEGLFSLDQENLHPGIMYMRKTKMEGNFNKRLIKILDITLQAANLLNNNDFNRDFDFTQNLFRFIANDRRIAENTLENQNLYQGVVREVLQEKYKTSNVKFVNISNKNERLAFTVNISTDINILEKT